VEESPAGRAVIAVGAGRLAVPAEVAPADPVGVDPVDPDADPVDPGVDPVDPDADPADPDADPVDPVDPDADPVDPDLADGVPVDADADPVGADEGVATIGRPSRASSSSV